MKRLAALLLTGLLASSALALTPDSKALEQDLQRLPWPQFRRVIEAIPKLKADVDAYGSFGWQIVQQNYGSYPWKKKIDKLSAQQQEELSELIQKAKTGQ